MDAGRADSWCPVAALMVDYFHAVFDRERSCRLRLERACKGAPDPGWLSRQGPRDVLPRERGLPRLCSLCCDGYPGREGGSRHPDVWHRGRNLDRGEQSAGGSRRSGVGSRGCPAQPAAQRRQRFVPRGTLCEGSSGFRNSGHLGGNSFRRGQAFETRREDRGFGSASPASGFESWARMVT